jgi:hypothetical protein
MKTDKFKERLKGAIFGVIVTVAVMTALPAFARVAQETITVNFNNIRIAINGQPVQTESDPFVFQGRTYLPVRDVANAMGFEVTWEDATNTVHLTSQPDQPNLNVVPNYPPHQPTPTPQATTPPTPPPPPPPIVGPSVTPPPPTPQPTASPSSRNARPTNPAISLQRAIEIAEADLVQRGITATFRSDSGMDWERGQWVWELEFRVTNAPRRSRHVIEFYIDVQSGDIVKFEWDD